MESQDQGGTYNGDTSDNQCDSDEYGCRKEVIVLHNGVNLGIGSKVNT